MRNLLERFLPQEEEQGNGLRPDGTAKGPGFFGELQRPDGYVSTELSTEVEVDGKKILIPLLVPDLSEDQRNYLLAGNKPTSGIVDVAVKDAMKRIEAGKSVFAQQGEQQPIQQEQPKERNLLAAFVPVPAAQETQEEKSLRRPEPFAGYNEQIDYWKKVIGDLPKGERSAIYLLATAENAFGLASWMSRKGLIFTEKDKGEVSAFFDALDEYHNESNRPVVKIMGKQVKLPDPAYLGGEVLKTMAEFYALPGGKAKTIGGQILGTAGKFAGQEALQFPTTEQSQLPMGEYLQQKAASSVKQGLIGGAMGVTGKLIPNPLYRIPLTTGGFMTLTAMEGGTPEQILSSGIQILGFEALGLAEQAYKGVGDIRAAIKAARKYNPKLNNISDEVLEEKIKDVADASNQAQANTTAQPEPEDVAGQPGDQAAPKQPQPENVTTEQPAPQEQVERIVTENPDLAAEIANKENPSRKDFEKIGITGLNAQQRKDLAGLIRDRIKQPAETIPTEQTLIPALPENTTQEPPEVSPIEKNTGLKQQPPIESDEIDIEKHTPSDLRNSWDDALTKHEDEVEKPALERIDKLKKEIDNIKGKKGKDVNAQRKKLKAAIEQTQNTIEENKADIENKWLDKMLKLNDGIVERAEKAGVKFKDDDDKAVFASEVGEQLSERPYIEDNFNRKIADIIDENIQNRLEESPEQSAEAQPAIEKQPDEDVLRKAEQDYNTYRKSMPNATDEEVVKMMIEDGLRPPKEKIEEYKHLPEMRDIIEEDKNRKIVRMAAREKNKGLKIKEPQKTTVEKQSWEKTQTELNSGKWRKLNQDEVKQLTDMRQSGSASVKYAKLGDESAYARTDEKGNIIDNWEIQVEKPKKLYSKEEHRKLINQAISEGKSVPADVLKDYPDLQNETDALKKAKTVEDKAEKNTGDLFSNIDGFEESKESGTSTAASFGRWSDEGEQNKKQMFGETEKAGPNIPDRQIFSLVDLVDLAKNLLDGKLPKIAKRLRSMSGMAKGVFSHGAGTKAIGLKDDIFIGPEITSGIARKERAADIAAQIKFNILQRGILNADDLVIRIEPHKKPGYVVITAYRVDPDYAAKVLAHEIGHLVDYLPQETMNRGNILGKIASVKDYLKEQLEAYPGAPGPITEAEKTQIMQQVKDMLGKDVEVEIDEVIKKTYGISPEDVLKIWNSTMDMRKVSPALYNYIARLSGAEKKAIILQAMKGKIPDELLQFARVEEVRTGRKIKQKIKIEATPENIEKKYRELFEAEIKKRGIIEKEAVLDELKKLTSWWNPIPPGVDPRYLRYRFSNNELYAEAISVLLNNPAALSDKAPIFNKAFFGWLGAKPEVQKQYLRIIDDIKNGMSIENANERLLDAFREGDEKAEKKYNVIRGGWDTIKKGLAMAFVDKAAITKNVARKARKAAMITAEKDPTYAIDRAVYSQSEHELYLVNFKRISAMLDGQNIDHDDFNLYLFHNRVINERKQIGNPEGFTPKTSKIALEEMRKRLGDTRFKILEQSQKEFWRNRKEMVIEKAQDAQMYGADLMNKLADNEHYATFDVIKYIDDKFGKGFGSQIHKQIGTFEQVRGPADATIEKDLALISSMNWNNAKRATCELLLKTQPDLIEVANKRWVNNHYEFQDPKDLDKELVLVMNNGELDGYYVDKWHAEIFNKEQAAWVETAAMVARVFGAPFRMIFTGIRPGFWGVNVVRDARRLLRNTPGANVHELALKYIEAIKPAFKSTFGDPTPEVEEMLKHNALISVADYGGLTGEKRTVDRLKTMYSGTKEYKYKYANPLWYFHSLLRVGEAAERIPKIAAWQFLKEHRPDMSIAEREDFVRTQAGSPSFLTKGELTWLTNNLFIFSNATVQGWRSDIKAYQDRPGGTSTKLAVFSIFPKMLMWGIASGGLATVFKAMGHKDDDPTVKWADGMRKLFDNIGEYDKTNYLCVPLGVTKEGKTVYVRAPFDENERFLTGVLWKLLNAHKNGLGTLSQLIDYTGGQIPSLNPAISTLFDTYNYLSGRNPYDYFRQRNVVPENVWNAGGWPKHAAFLKHISNNLGVGIIKQFSESDIQGVKSELEQYVNAPVLGDILGRFIKISDRGKSEILRDVAQQQKTLRAKDLAVLKTAIDKQAKGETLTVDEQELMDENKAYVASRQKRNAAVQSGNVYNRELLYAKTTEERYNMQKKIKEVEGSDFDLTPYIENDILIKGKVLVRQRPKKREDIEDWKNARTEAIQWLKERDVKPADVIKEYTEYLKKLKIHNKADRIRILRRELQGLTGKNYGLKQ